MRGWKKDISKAKRFIDLPAEAQAYLKRVEQLTGIPISWVGVGAGRLEMATQVMASGPAASGPVDRQRRWRLTPLCCADR
jgi:hypothetical protein